MNADRLLALYDRVADAPDAVGRLRRFVLDLAVRGKLVEQDPADEPALELLGRITAEKARLIRAGELRRRKKMPLRLGEPPFAVPGNWIWSRIGDVVSDRGQRVPDRPFTYIDVSAIDKKAGLVADPRVLEPSNAPSRARKVARSGDVVYSCVRPYLLNVAVIEDDYDPPPIASTAFEVLNGHGLLLPRYTWIVLRSSLIIGCVEQSQRGQAYPAISSADFAVLPFPLPPLIEQHRIAAKVDELLALCDQLEEGRTAREDTRDRLTRASFVQLAATDTDSSTVRSHARFAVEVLSALTARADQLEHLRQMISSLAFCGKLVEQDPQEGSGHDVHARLTSARKPSLGTRSLSKSIDGMYPLPSSWTWVSLGQAIVAGPRNGLSPRSSAREDAPRAVTLTATTSGVFDGSHFKRVDVDIGPDSEYWLQPNDLLFQRGNTPEYVGMAAIYNGPPGKFLFPDLMIRVRLSPDVSLRFVHLFCISPAARSYFSENAVGAQKTMPKINQAILRSLPIPLPPLAEQHRIVAKVDEFMALCDRLKAGLGAAEVTRGHLLDSLIHESLASHEAARIWSTLGAAGGGA